MEIRQLGREIKTALELAIAAIAPAQITEKLAMMAGLLEAIAEFPADSAPVIQLVPKTIKRAKQALDDWQKWRRSNLPRASA
jgi:hypothetical protein